MKINQQQSRMAWVYLAFSMAKKVVFNELGHVVKSSEASEEKPHLTKSENHYNEKGASLHQHTCGHGYDPSDRVFIHGRFMIDTAPTTLGGTPRERRTTYIARYRYGDFGDIGPYGSR